jgi:uncharacterized protein YjbJ (UPF0337 family)
MDENRIEGGIRNVGGKLQDAAGGLTGDAATQARGKVNQAAGQAQQAYGQALDEARDFVLEQPITAVAVAVGFGIVIGLALGRR